MNPVFHASCLKPYHADAVEPARNVSTRDMPPLTPSSVPQVEAILADRVRYVGTKKQKEYLVKWLGLPESEASWETEALFRLFPDKLKDYKRQALTRTSMVSGGL